MHACMHACTAAEREGDNDRLSSSRYEERSVYMQVYTFCFNFIPPEGGRHCQRSLQVLSMMIASMQLVHGSPWKTTDSSASTSTDPQAHFVIHRIWRSRSRRPGLHLYARPAWIQQEVIPFVQYRRCSSASGGNLPKCHAGSADRCTGPCAACTRGSAPQLGAAGRRDQAGHQALHPGPRLQGLCGQGGGPVG